MNTNIAKYKIIIEHYKNFPVEIQKTILHSPPRSFVKCIREICTNIINRNVKLTPKQVIILKKHAKIIIKLAAKGFLEQKKKLLRQKHSFILIQNIFEYSLPTLKQKLENV
jgi:hypothetical protein